MTVAAAFFSFAISPGMEEHQEKGKQEIIKNNIIAYGCNRKRLYVAHFHSYLA
jgi:hypothetical protein